MTKEEKRAKKKKDRGIVDFLMIQNHFFKDFRNWIEEMEDPRNKSFNDTLIRNLTFGKAVNPEKLDEICSECGLRD